MSKKIVKWLLGSGLITTIMIFLIVACSQPHIVTNYGTSPEIYKNNKKLKVAVIPFQNATGIGGIGQKISDEFSIQLLKNENFVVLERSRLNQVFEELDIEKNANIEGDDALRIGKLLKADAVIIGTVYRYRPLWVGEKPPEVGISVRMVTVNQGQTIWAGSDNFRGDDYSIQLLVPPQDRWQLRKNVNYLSKILCRELARTIGS